MRPIPSPQVASTPAPAVDQETAAQFQRLEALQQQAMKLELRVADLNVRVNQLREQRDAASPAERPKLDKQFADAQHDMAAAAIELTAAHAKIGNLEQMLNRPVAVTMQPPVDPFLNSNQIMNLATGGFLLTLPLVLALARRLWVRGVRAAPPVDLESSPRLQRIEQAIESIAVEVERIGEAQRFTTKLLTERPPAAEVNRIAPAAGPASVVRREVGTNTPH